MLGVWDDEKRRAPVVALFRSAMSDDQAAVMIREFATIEILGRIVKAANRDQQELRMTLLCVAGLRLLMLRYIIKLEPLASADPRSWSQPSGPLSSATSRVRSRPRSGPLGSGPRRRSQTCSRSTSRTSRSAGIGGQLEAGRPAVVGPCHLEGRDGDALAIVGDEIEAAVFVADDGRIILEGDRQREGPVRRAPRWCRRPRAMWNPVRCR